jgi:hypothetical protein
LQVEYYRLPLGERLSVIPIPIRQTDRDVPLDLQSLIDECYEVGRYGDDIDYSDAPEPPLKSDDARWADALLRAQGRR